MDFLFPGLRPGAVVLLAKFERMVVMTRILMFRLWPLCIFRRILILHVTCHPRLVACILCSILTWGNRHKMVKVPLRMVLLTSIAHCMSKVVYNVCTFYETCSSSIAWNTAQDLQFHLFPFVFQKLIHTQTFECVYGSIQPQNYLGPVCHIPHSHVVLRVWHCCLMKPASPYLQSNS